MLRAPSMSTSQHEKSKGREASESVDLVKEQGRRSVEVIRGLTQPVAPYKRPAISTNRGKLPTERNLPDTDERIILVTIVHDIHEPAEEIESSKSKNCRLAGRRLWGYSRRICRYHLWWRSLDETPPFFSLIRTNQLDDHPFSSTRHPQGPKLRNESTSEDSNTCT